MNTEADFTQTLCRTHTGDGGSTSLRPLNMQCANLCDLLMQQHPVKHTWGPEVVGMADLFGRMLMILMMPSDDPVMTVSASYFTRASTEPGCPARPCTPFQHYACPSGKCEPSGNQSNMIRWNLEGTMPQLGKPTKKSLPCSVSMVTSTCCNHKHNACSSCREAI